MQDLMAASARCLDCALHNTGLPMEVNDFQQFGVGGKVFGGGPTTPSTVGTGGFVPE